VPLFFDEVLPLALAPLALLPDCPPFPDCPPEPVILLVASAAPSTAPDVAPATVPMSTSVTVSRALLIIPFFEPLLPPVVFLEAPLVFFAAPVDFFAALDEEVFGLADDLPPDLAAVPFFAPEEALDDEALLFTAFLVPVFDAVDFLPPLFELDDFVDAIFFLLENILYLAGK